ncbi:MAG: YdcF family protein [Planctomycetota bacterium]
MFRRLLEAFATPPGGCLVLLLAGLLLRRRWPRLGLGLQLAGLISLWLFSTPVFAGLLLGSLQTAPPLPATGPLPDAQAIVVLSAEADGDGFEYGGGTVGSLTLRRMRYAAVLHHRTGLPVLTSGGRPGTGLPPMAELMARTLEAEFRVPVRWQEGRSADTWENAKYSAELLAADGIRRVLLVTHAWHLPRAIRSFEHHGLTVVPAPTAFRGPCWVDALSLVPSASAVRDSALALHEWLGRLAYWFRG